MTLRLVAAVILAALSVLGLGWRLVAEGGCPSNGSSLTGAGCSTGRP